MTKKDLEKLTGHKRAHKYGAKATTCNLGHQHPSKSEATHCWALQAQQKGNVNDPLVVDLEYEKPYRLEVNGRLITVHKPDFTYKRYAVAKVDGKNLVVCTQCVDEVKGFKTADWIIKSKLFQALYPEIEYRVVE